MKSKDEIRTSSFLCSWHVGRGAGGVGGFAFQGFFLSETVMETRRVPLRATKYVHLERYATSGATGSLHREKGSAVGDQIAQANLVCYIEAFTLSRVLNGLSNETGCAEVTVYTNAKVIEATEEILGV